MSDLLQRFYAGEPSNKTAIKLFDDQLFDITNPDTWSFNVDTIAQSLSNLCRFNGHCFFYSVAEHAVRVSYTLEEWGAPQIVQYLGLHHDDIEAFIGDIPSPQKSLYMVDGEPIKDLEQSMEYAYFATLGILTPAFDYHWATVKDADTAVYLLERDERPHMGRELGPLMAKAEYMARHREMAYLFTDTVHRYQ